MFNQEFAIDENGKEILLRDNEHQVMMEWEKPYMEAIIDEIKPTGDVLEIGFGCGYSATRIQHYKPKSHTIIECDLEVIKQAKAWAQNYKNITIIENTWQKSLHTVGNFDFIFLDDYPLNMHKVLNDRNTMDVSLQNNRFFMFVDICLDWHMKEGAILSTYLEDSKSKFENNHFERLIISNPKVYYSEKIIDVEVPSNCKYFKGSKAVIPIIQRTGV